MFCPFRQRKKPQDLLALKTKVYTEKGCLQYDKAMAICQLCDMKHPVPSMYTLGFLWWSHLVEDCLLVSFCEMWYTNDTRKRKSFPDRIGQNGTILEDRKKPKMRSILGFGQIGTKLDVQKTYKKGSWIWKWRLANLQNFYTITLEIAVEQMCLHTICWPIFLIQLPIRYWRNCSRIRCENITMEEDRSLRWQNECCRL